MCIGIPWDIRNGMPAACRLTAPPPGWLKWPRKTQKARPLHGWAMIWTLLGIFAGGIALNLTPCVYPLIPITVSYFGGKSGQGQGRLYLHGASYIGGLAVTNSILGLAAALTGGLMGAMLQNPVVLGSIAAILILLATSLFGFWELRLPYWLNRAASRSYSGYFGSLFMGITLGVVAAPCIGPFVLGLLTWVAGMGSPWLGFLIFFTLSLGLGLPLFILAMFSGKLDKLPRSGEWMIWIRKLMGWVLVGMAAYFIRPLLPSTIGMLLMAAVALAAGLHLGWIDRTTGRLSRLWLVEDRRRIDRGGDGNLLDRLIHHPGTRREMGCLFRSIVCLRPSKTANRSSLIFQLPGAPPAGNWTKLPSTTAKWSNRPRRILL